MKLLNICFIILASALLLPACQDYVDGYEEDIINPTDAPLASVLNAAFTGTIIAHEGEDARLACMWSRQFTGSDRQYAAYNVYNINAEDFEWDKYYIVVENAMAALDRANAVDNKLGMGIAKILRAHSMGMVTSMWGNIPFREANQLSEIPDPVFDDQVQVYTDIQSLLDEAIQDLSGNPVDGNIANIDFYYGGDAAQWTKLAYSLKARFYLHTAKTDASHYDAALQALGSGIQDVADEWVIPHTGGGYNQDMNIYHSFGVLDRDGYMTAAGAYLPTILDASNAEYRGNAKTDEAARFEDLFTDAGDPDNYKLNFTGRWSATSPYTLVSAVEMALIEAECHLRINSGNTADALTALNMARQMNAVRYPDGTYEDYVIGDFDENGMAGMAGASPADALLYEIVEEKYCSLVGHMEVFNDFRRTANLLGVQATTGNNSDFPQRFFIPQVEINGNANTPSPIPGLADPTPVNK